MFYKARGRAAIFLLGIYQNKPSRILLSLGCLISATFVTSLFICSSCIFVSLGLLPSFFPLVYYRICTAHDVSMLMFMFCDIILHMIVKVG